MGTSLQMMYDFLFSLSLSGTTKTETKCLQKVYIELPGSYLTEKRTEGKNPEQTPAACTTDQNRWDKTLRAA